MTATELPAALAGYTLIPRDGSFNDALFPLGFKVNEQGKFVFALQLEPRHCNPAGICHGAMYMALMDFAMAGAICSHLQMTTFTPTITMTLNYMGSARAGDILYAEGEVMRTTRTFAFTEARIHSDDGELKVQATGTFRLPKAQAG